MGKWMEKPGEDFIFWVLAEKLVGRHLMFVLMMC
jgi:hypothetical protein